MIPTPLYFPTKPADLPRGNFQLLICLGDENDPDAYAMVSGLSVAVLLQHEVFLALENSSVLDPDSKPAIREGMILMADEGRSKRFIEIALKHDQLDNRLGLPVMNVFRDGALSARRGARRMVMKASRQELPQMRQAYTILNRYFQFLFTFTHGDQAAINKYEADIRELAEAFKGTTKLKEEIYRLLTNAVVDDVLKRKNKERIPLMLAAAKRRIESLMRHLRSWEIVANERATVISSLCDAVIAEAETDRLVISQALSSSRLLIDNGDVDNKDTAVIFWRGCAERLRGYSVIPFRRCLRNAGIYLDAAANALETGTIAVTRDHLQSADAFLRLTQIQDLLDSVLEPFAELKDLGGSMDTLERAELAFTLENVGNALTEVTEIVEELRVLDDGLPWNLARAGRMIAGTLDVMNPSENMFLRPVQIEEIYFALLVASRDLSGQ